MYDGKAASWDTCATIYTTTKTNYRWVRGLNEKQNTYLKNDLELIKLKKPLFELFEINKEFLSKNKQ